MRAAEQICIIDSLGKAGKSDAPQTTAFLARTSGLSANETLGYRTLINNIVALGVFAGLDCLYIRATKDTTTANLNLIQNVFNCTQHGTPASFVADAGDTGDASTFWLDTGYIPASSGGKFSLNGGTLGVYQPGSRTASVSSRSIGATDGTNYSYLGTDPVVQFDLNGATFPNAANSDIQGAWSVSRTASGAVSIFNNDVSAPYATASDTSAALPAISSISLFGLNQNGAVSSKSGDLISAAWIGDLTAAQITALHIEVNRFIATVNPGLNIWSVLPVVTLGAIFKYNSGYPAKSLASDTFAVTWADDDNLYTTNDDTLHQWNGGGTGGNLEVSLLSDFSTSLTGSLVNVMSAFGTASQEGSDGATYKAYGLISVNGVLYATVSRQQFAQNGAFQFTSANGQIIKSSDHGVTWTPLPSTVAQPYTSPMFPGSIFPAPVFIQYGKDYQGQTVDNSNLYVYALSNDSGWNNGSQLYLGRCLISAIGNLSASDWSYYKGNSSGDITNSANWDSTFSNAVPVLSSKLKLGISGAQYVPALGKYVMFQWYYPDIANGGGLQFARTNWTVYESPSPRGPWTTKQTIEWTTNGLYDARIIPKSVSGKTFTIACAGNFNDTNVQTGEYTLQLIPVTMNS